MRLPFELDPAIIHHVIYSQAGSIGKALIELIMNSVDAKATRVVVTLTKEGFTCVDDGVGFATRKDVKRHFGRFGTPHQEGDATFGRFRLGRGQIMAHARTVWRSRRYQMSVDTQTMGYAYDLDPIPHARIVRGCEISGSWYELLTDTELLSTTQEIRDLVRYTPVIVELNGREISRDPRAEKWDHEDEFAWYRVKVEGAVSIYNQGVLVRHDPAQQWGAGGVIVSKQAIALNVSRTEILRKTCAVWRPIAAEFGALARAISARLGDHRKTEARREKAAHDLLAGDADIVKIFGKEEVITLLPGKRHVSLHDFLELNRQRHSGKVSVVEEPFDVPKGEAIAREKIAAVIHPSTLARFGCHAAGELRDVIERILQTVASRWESLSDLERHESGVWSLRSVKAPEFIEFEVLREAFVDRSVIVSEKDVLDPETRRAWTALRWCIQQYAGICAGGQQARRSGRLYGYGNRKLILLGESNAMEAWTDGETYIAFNVNVVKRLKSDPVRTAAYLLCLTEHEVAHEGDSIDCGHDEAFYQRYHDISIEHASERQHYLHLFMRKYVYSLEGEGKRTRNRLWSEQRLIERANDAREQRELPRAIEDLTAHAVLARPAMPEDADFISAVNMHLIERGACPPPPDWAAVREQAREEHGRREQVRREYVAQREREDNEIAAAFAEVEQQDRERIARILDVAPDDIDALALQWLSGMPDGQLKTAWEDQTWMHEYGLQPEEEMDVPFDGSADFSDWEAEQRAYEAEMNDPASHLDAEHGGLVLAGETWWSVERNAAAAGFSRVEDYLRWRAERPV